MSNPSYELSAAHRALYHSALEFARSTVDIAADADESDGIHPEMRARLADSGYCELMVPSEFGGRFGHVDPLSVALVREAFAGWSSHLDSMFAMQGIGSFALARAGSQELQARWLPGVARLEVIAALALTEPEAGSDLKALRTTVRSDGEELVLQGHKTFITNGGDADYYCVLGKEDGGYSLVLVPAATPGLTTERSYQILSPHVLSDVLLRDVQVPAAHRIGEPGGGFPHVLATLATFRVSVAGEALGIARAALELALAHATSREVAGRPLARLGSVPGTLALAWTELETARTFTYRAAAAAGADPLGALHLSSMAKITATEAAGRIVDRCVQVMGRFGLIRGSHIERLYRASRPARVYEGATEVLLDALARKLVKDGFE